MRSFAFGAFVTLMALSLSCSRDRRDLPTSFDYSPPPTPTGFTVTGGEERSILSWSYDAAARASIKGFNVYLYFEAYDTAELVLVGTTTDTFFVHSLLIGNVSYCYEISAVDGTGLEGWRTEKECTFVWSSVQ